MIHVLLASHSDFADSLKRTGEMICGQELMKDMESVAIREGEEGITQLKNKCLAYLEKYEKDEFLILTDIVGASPFNICSSVFYHTKYYIVTGMNLPMLLESAIKKDSLPLLKLANAVKEAGLQGIEVINMKEQIVIEDEELMEDFL